MILTLTLTLTLALPLTLRTERMPRMVAVLPVPGGRGAIRQPHAELGARAKQPAHDARVAVARGEHERRVAA